MRTLKAGALALLCVTVCTGSAATQQQVQTIQIGPGGAEGIQFPGPGRQLKTGTGRIKGRLATADTGTPVRRAQVRISGPDIMPKTAVTDSNGRYEFRDLPAGRFNINATKAGFVTVNYGQTRPFETGKAIDLGEAQVMDKADITMPRGSAISGRIVDEFGEPLADAQVSAMRSAWSNGKRRLQPAGRTAQTNDLGQYRIYGLPPGEYYVERHAARRRRDDDGRERRRHLRERGWQSVAVSLGSAFRIRTDCTTRGRRTVPKHSGSRWRSGRKCRAPISACSRSVSRR